MKHHSNPCRNSLVSRRKQPATHQPCVCSCALPSTWPLKSSLVLVGPVVPAANGHEAAGSLANELLWFGKKPFSCCSAEPPYSRSWRPALFQSGQSSSGRRGKLKGIWEEMIQNIIRARHCCWSRKGQDLWCCYVGNLSSLRPFHPRRWWHQKSTELLLNNMLGQNWWNSMLRQLHTQKGGFV